MCLGEGLPPVDRVERLKGLLEAQPDQAQDIYALDSGSDMAANQIVGRENEITNNIDASTIHETLLDEGRVAMPYTLPSDYDDIFDQPGMSRRSAREVPPEDHQPDQDGREDLIWEWVHICLANPSPKWDHYHPGDMEAWGRLIDEDIPDRLHLNSWIADLTIMTAFELLQEEVAGLADLEYSVREWQEHMDPHEVRWEKGRDGLYRDMLCFLGIPKPGHLVWRPRVKAPLPFGHGIAFCNAIRNMLRQIELALVALGRRIARHVACQVVYGYSLPEFERRGFGILNRKQVSRAVREILGAAWFDLPFDTSGSLRNWSEDDVLKPDDEMHGLHVFFCQDATTDEIDLEHP